MLTTGSNYIPNEKSAQRRAGDPPLPLTVTTFSGNSCHETPADLNSIRNHQLLPDLNLVRIAQLVLVGLEDLHVLSGIPVEVFGNLR